MVGSIPGERGGRTIAFIAMSAIRETKQQLGPGDEMKETPIYDTDDWFSNTCFRRQLNHRNEGSSQALSSHRELLDKRIG